MMSHGSEKRLLLAWLAALAPAPLPFNQMLEWPLLLAYWLGIAVFLRRTERGAPNQLPNWALNVLGLLYMPVLAIEVWSGVRTSFTEFVKALLHLTLFVVVVKLFSLRKERDKWHLMIILFFLFLGAMATSSHLAIALYLVAFLVLVLHVLARFAHLHVLTSFVNAPASAEQVRLRWPLVVGVLLTLLVSIPLFALLPRLREPFVLGAGSGSSGLIRSTGFSDNVDLNLTSSIRGNRDVALRMQYLEGSPKPAELRLKGATYDRYQISDRTWGRSTRRSTVMTPRGGRRFELASGGRAARAEIYLEPTLSRSLILPLQTLAIELPITPTLELDPGGAVLLPGLFSETLSYIVDLSSRPVIAATDPRSHASVSALDEGGLTPRIRELAARVIGDGEIEERITRLERYLLTQYSYTTDFVGRSGESPLEDFLFQYRSGHCELFASAMVLMLRSQGIPARFVSGFLGAELNPFEGYLIVRQQNAHAWVEAYTPSGWQVYDPTPPDGRPSTAEQSLGLLLSQVYDYLIFRWDRYVLSFGADDQIGFFQQWRRRVAAWWKAFTELGKSAPEPTVAPGGPITGALEGGLEGDRSWPFWQVLLVGLLAGALVAFSAALWRHQHPRDAATAYRHLRDQLRRRGLEVNHALPPLAVQRLVARGVPAAAESARTVVGFYLREGYAGQPLSQQDRRAMWDALRAAVGALRQ